MHAQNIVKMQVCASIPAVKIILKKGVDKGWRTRYNRRAVTETEGKNPREETAR